MLALIDIGNTTISIGLSKTLDKIDHVLRINTAKTILADEYAFLLNQSLKGVTEAIISSVVPELNEVFKEYFQNWLDITPVFLGQGLKTGIKIMTDNPKEVGTDLIANIVAATDQYGKTALSSIWGRRRRSHMWKTPLLRVVSSLPALPPAKTL
jgi:type III pantothenate kinase